MAADLSKNYLILNLIIAFLYIAKSLIIIDISYIEFWDLNVYDRAITNDGPGAHPYRQDVSPLFVYHAYVLKTFMLLNHLFSIKIWLGCFCFATTTLFFREFLVFAKIAQKTSSVQKSKYYCSFVSNVALFWRCWINCNKDRNHYDFSTLFLIAIFFTHISGSWNKMAMVRQPINNPGHNENKHEDNFKLPALITAEPIVVAKDIFNAQKKKRDVIYPLWCWI
jgi:hypothetical protein